MTALDANLNLLTEARSIELNDIKGTNNKAMKLFYSPSSPYARKVRIFAIEKGLHGEIEEIAVSPFDVTPTSIELSSANPLLKIPTLILNDGTAIYDSRVICEYFDVVGDGSVLIPRNPEDRIQCLTAAAMAEGIIDAAFNLVMELRRPIENRSNMWIERWASNIDRGLKTMGSHLTDGFDVRHITAICAIDYLNFRMPDRFLVPATVATWRSRHAACASINETTPSELA